MKQPKIWTLREIGGKMCECYCTINFEYQNKHFKYIHHIVEFDEKGMKTIPVINKNYDPRIKKPRKPLYCKRKPSNHCYKNNCPYFSYCEYNSNEGNRSG